MFIPKKGDIVFMWNDSIKRDMFHEITDVNTKEEPIMKTVGLFKRKPTGKTRTILKKVWFRPIGDSTGMHYTSMSTAAYNWEKLISNADILLHQAKQIINNQKN